MRNRFWLLVLSVIVFPIIGLTKSNPAFNGNWELISEISSEISLYDRLSLQIQLDDARVRIIEKWGTGRSFSDTLDFRTDGKVSQVPIRNRVFPTNVFMGLAMPVNGTRKITGAWEADGNTLKMEQTYSIRGSQGQTTLVSTHIYELSPGNETIRYTTRRSTRAFGPEIKFILKPAGSRNAYFMKLEDDWDIEGKLPNQALLISLQGVVNKSGTNLYFIYPENWAFHYTPAVFDFYQKKRFYTFKQLNTVEQAIDTFKDKIKGYVVWDKSVRTSLIVAFTVCGLENAVAVTEEMIPVLEKAGLTAVADFRGQFAGKSDAEIYTWAYDQYWGRCSRDFIIWMGGEHGRIMKPGVADWGIYNNAFFNDLSTRPEDGAEFALANKVLSQMKPLAMVMGWHSYAKDKERDHVTLTSSYGLRVEGLHTIPNLSFSHNVPPMPGFVFKNNHHIEPGKDYTPENKVYISCVQTDGMGIGAWLKPGRGEIPYAWEVIMNYVWLAPAMQEFFYSTATANDYFIGALSGPGYMYPKAVPPKKLPAVIAKARELMTQLDLRVFEIMDYSEGATVEGNTELTQSVVAAYYENMPDAIGFLNGYAPSFTFTSKDGRPLISYDYYLSPTRPEAEAIADLEELAKINAQRPYFLLMHVRESSDIKRVKNILDKLSPEFAVVPLDLFLMMAGKKPTFQERFLDQ